MKKYCTLLLIVVIAIPICFWIMSHFREQRAYVVPFETPSPQEEGQDGQTSTTSTQLRLDSGASSKTTLNTDGIDDLIGEVDTSKQSLLNYALIDLHKKLESNAYSKDYAPDMMLVGGKFSEGARFWIALDEAHNSLYFVDSEKSQYEVIAKTDGKIFRAECSISGRYIAYLLASESTGAFLYLMDRNTGQTNKVHNIGGYHNADTIEFSQSERSFFVVFHPDKTSPDRLLFLVDITAFDAPKVTSFGPIQGLKASIWRGEKVTSLFVDNNGGLYFAEADLEQRSFSNPKRAYPALDRFLARPTTVFSPPGNSCLTWDKSGNRLAFDWNFMTDNGLLVGTFVYDHKNETVTHLSKVHGESAWKSENQLRVMLFDTNTNAQPYTLNLEDGVN